MNTGNAMKKLARGRIELCDPKVVRGYVESLRDLLTESPIMQQKAFVRTFVKEIRVTGDEVLLTYTIPLGPDGASQERESVLDIVQGGRAHRTRTCNPLIKSQLLCQIELAPHTIFTESNSIT